MKYPLRVVDYVVGRQPGAFPSVVDGSGKIIFNVVNDPDAVRFAHKVVKQANRRWRWFGAPKPHTREDWIAEKNTFGVSQ